MENKVFNNIVISTTSNKTDGEFKQEIPTKTAYITTTDQATSEALEKYGLTKYTSKEKNENFFIIKLVNNLKVYFPNGENMLRKDMSNTTFEGQDTLNFKTADGVHVSVNIVKGENKGNEFFRIQAILVNDMNDISQIEPENPFA